MKTVFIIIIFFVSLMEAEAQSRADRMFERGSYLEALKLYQKELESTGEKTQGSDRLKARIANCFFHLNDVVRAGQMYKSLNQDILETEDLLFYATTLQRSGEYDKALQLLDVIESMGGDMAAAEQLKTSCGFAKELAKEKPLYVVNKTNIDFAGFSAGATYYKGKGIIVAAPAMGEAAAKDSRGYKFTRLYNAILDGEGKGGRLIPFGDELIDKYHIGAVTFTRDFNRIYYTKTILKKDGTSILKLMTAESTNGKWGNIKELNINSDDYSCAHPSLYRDSLLFFVSDMPGGYGGKDIYATTVSGEECGEVQNLGEVINTPDDELFPFVALDGKMYFSSNGHVGIGGLDIFVSQMNTDGQWSDPQNMGRPINSSMDDFGLVFRDTKCMEGYVSSNRGGTGYNDFLFSLKLMPNRNAGPARAGSLYARADVTQGKKYQEKEKPVVVPAGEMYSVDYQYTIQIGAFRNPVSRVYFENFKNVKVYRGYDNLYRYTTGDYPDREQADSDVNGVRKMIWDAFVVDEGQYVAEHKICNDRKGDNVSDDELLLIRLKNFEQQKKMHMGSLEAVRQTKHYLNKPVNSEVSFVNRQYTVVLMSADRVLDMSKFSNIPEIDIFSTGDGTDMYCSGSFITQEEADRHLRKVRQLGFQNAYIVKDGSRVASSRNEVAANRNDDALRELLGQYK